MSEGPSSKTITVSLPGMGMRRLISFLGLLQLNFIVDAVER